MARGAQKTPGPRKATHSRARCRRGGAPPTTLGQGRKELRFRFPQRQENARRSLRRQKPTHRLSPYVRSGVARSLPELLLQHGPYGPSPYALGTTRRLLRGSFPRAHFQDRSLQEAHGMEVQLGLVLRKRLQLAWDGSSTGSRPTEATSTTTTTSPSGRSNWPRARSNSTLSSWNSPARKRPES